ncbi:MAG: DUF1223 domain-containing protein [Vicinamibacterales bacterium]
MKILATLPVIVLGMLGSSWGDISPMDTDPGRTVVVAELFTSEGCSSCPPADALLRRLLSKQPVEGVEIAGLGNHVDYWDRLGWRDPFSSPVFSERQVSYDTAVFRSKGAYTPQLVVDGNLQCVASDEAAVRALLIEAAARPKGTILLQKGVVNATSATVTIDVRMPANVGRRGMADIVVAVTEDDLATQVQRGENRGRRLLHAAVVRRFAHAAQLGGDEHEATVTATVALDPAWIAQNVRLMAFVQEQKSRRIIAASSSMGLSPLAATRSGPSDAGR